MTKREFIAYMAPLLEKHASDKNYLRRVVDDLNAGGITTLKSKAAWTTANLWIFLRNNREAFERLGIFPPRAEELPAIQAGGKTFKPVPQDELMKLIKVGRWVRQIEDLLDKEEKQKEKRSKWALIPVILHEDVLQLCDMKLKGMKADITLNQVINDRLVEWLGLLQDDWDEQDEESEPES